MATRELWNTFKSRLVFDRKSGFAIDLSRLNFKGDYLASMEPAMVRAFDAMEKLEAGEIANPDEKRMVGHYWLRDARKAPSSEIGKAIEDTNAKIKSFAADVHSGKIAPPKGGRFECLLVVGIGGSALGPQFVTQALSGPQDKMSIAFFDNTDPDGMAKVLHAIPSLAKTLVVVISKSGGTKETRNGQLIAKEAMKRAGLDFAKQFVAVTGEGSELDQTATKEGWLERFPMWDWVGGRTSELSAVGMLPMALQGFDVDAVLAGARYMDGLTAVRKVKDNPAALLGLAWYHCGCGKGTKDMVVLPYKDRLELFSRYLQQLLMESLGKEMDLSGKAVNQGIAVYGNKGSTDQHAYVQQLREGLNNFFAVFIEVLKDPSPKSANPADDFTPHTMFVEDGITSGDYLTGFFLGTRDALYEKGRESVTVTVNEVNEYTVGMLIALFERTVGYYATMVNINAYHQPGVEAGKKAATEVLRIQKLIEEDLKKDKSPRNAEKIAVSIGLDEQTETVFKVLRHLGANGRVKIAEGSNVFEDTYSI